MKIKIKIKIKNNFFLGSGSLNPAELRRVKRAGHSQFTVAVSVLLYPQVHELLMRCSRCLRHRSYVILSNVFEMDAFMSPHFSKTNLFRSCHGYCLTPHTHSWSWFG
jgi:hypothetical protein